MIQSTTSNKTKYIPLGHDTNKNQDCSSNENSSAETLVRNVVPNTPYQTIYFIRHELGIFQNFIDFQYVNVAFLHYSLIY